MDGPEGFSGGCKEGRYLSRLANVAGHGSRLPSSIGNAFGNDVEPFLAARGQHHAGSRPGSCHGDFLAYAPAGPGDDDALVCQADFCSHSGTLPCRGGP